METELTARSVSVDILNEFGESKQVKYSFANDLEPREKAQVREYVQNILRKKSYLDFLIDEFSSISIDEMKSQLKNILRLGLYEMLFMDGTPDYAAINEAVDIAKYTLGSKSGDLVNAILRNIQRDIDNLPKPAFKDRTKLVATTFSHPEWLVKKWSKRFGEREAFQLMQANNQRPVFYVRVNNLRTKTENFKLRMEKSGIQFEESDWLPGYFKVDTVEPFISKGWIDKGFCLVQDIAAGFAPTILDPQPGETIYDLCAAPGTKSIVLSDLMGGEGSVIAVDISTERLEKLAESALDFGAENIKIRRSDVRELSLKLTDGVLLDAPCTGTGVMSKRADLRWKRTEQDLADAVKLQSELLDEAANFVKKGGRLVYSTCSLEEEENWGQVQNFLSAYDNFELDDLSDYLPEEVLTEDGKAYQTFPHKHNCDGHFGVRLVRVK
ncbi:MAG TPA: 16S rRNA (cytosine(967)-C(5))-methyltransferase RsmB [Balneolaceae bacterium]|nr:16S rRNA (cytosine(967)-C(5))-methyltransferase RsmB [Balneolaceae bacterium]